MLTAVILLAVGAGLALPVAVTLLRIRDVHDTTTRPDPAAPDTSSGTVHHVHHLVVHQEAPAPAAPREIPVQYTVTPRSSR